MTGFGNWCSLLFYIQNVIWLMIICVRLGVLWNVPDSQLSWNVNLHHIVSVEWWNGKLWDDLIDFKTISLFSYVDKADGFNVGIKWIELLSFALFALLCSVDVHKIATMMTELCCWYKWSHDFSISPVSVNVTGTWIDF